MIKLKYACVILLIVSAGCQKSADTIGNNSPRSTISIISPSSNLDIKGRAHTNVLIVNHPDIIEPPQF